MNHYYRKMLLFQRLAGSPKLRSYNLAEHSFFVGLLFTQLCDANEIGYSADILKTVLLHDFVEVLTTDLPYPIKNLNEVTQGAWALIEDQAVSNFKHRHEIEHLTDAGIRASLTEVQFELFKIADMLELWIFCKEEQQLGNHSPQIDNIVVKVQEWLLRSTPQFSGIVPIMKEYLDVSI